MFAANGMIWLYVPFGLVTVWFILLFALWFRLIGKHRATYSAMLNSSLAPLFGMPGPWVTVTFIVFRRHRTLGDSRLSFLSDASLVVLVFYIAILLTSVISTGGN